MFGCIHCIIFLSYLRREQEKASPQWLQSKRGIWIDENKCSGTKSKQEVVATVFGIQKMVLFVWVCIVFMNLFICSLWLSQLPSAERLCFINTAWHSQESLLQTYAHSILICWGFQKKKTHTHKICWHQYYSAQTGAPMLLLCKSHAYQKVIFIQARTYVTASAANTTASTTTNPIFEYLFQLLLL